MFLTTARHLVNILLILSSWKVGQLSLEVRGARRPSNEALDLPIDGNNEQRNLVTNDMSLGP